MKRYRLQSVVEYVNTRLEIGVQQLKIREHGKIETKLSALIGLVKWVRSPTVREGITHIQDHRR